MQDRYSEDKGCGQECKDWALFLQSLALAAATTSAGLHDNLYNYSVRLLTQVDAILTGLPVDPEGDPGHNDQQRSGGIDFDHEAPHQALEVEGDDEARVGTA